MDGWLVAPSGTRLTLSITSVAPRRAKAVTHLDPIMFERGNSRTVASILRVNRWLAPSDLNYTAFELRWR